MPPIAKRSITIGPADIAGLLGGPDTSSGESIRPPTISENIWDYSEPLRKAIGFLLGNDEISQAQSALAPSASIINDPLKTKLAKEIAELAHNSFKSAGLDKMARAVGDILSSPRHSAIVSTLRDAGTTLEPELLGSYSPGNIQQLIEALKRNPSVLHMSPTMAKNADEEFITRLATGQHGGRIGFSPRLENEPIAEVYKVGRHELSHAADNLTDKEIGLGFARRGNDPRYWVNLAEVRARASEPNYVRDMTGRADSSDLLRRPKYVDKVIREIQEGKRIGEGKLPNVKRWSEVYSSIHPSNLDVANRKIKDFSDELSNTVSHYFGPTVRREEILHPRRTKLITEPGRLSIPRQGTNPLRPSYDWEQLIRPNVETSSGLSGPSARAYQDLLLRLRGRE